MKQINTVFNFLGDFNSTLEKELPEPSPQERNQQTPNQLPEIDPHTKLWSHQEILQFETLRRNTYTYSLESIA